MTQKRPSGRPAKDLAGLRFGLLTVAARQGTIRKTAAWVCRCACGGEKVASSSSLIRGETRSCGCIRRGGKRNVLGPSGRIRRGESLPAVAPSRAAELEAKTIGVRPHPCRTCTRWVACDGAELGGSCREGLFSAGLPWSGSCEYQVVPDAL